RIINLVVGLQVATIFISRGDVDRLGEAYAFGVVWSFAMKALAVIVLRFKAPDVPRWRVPFNVRAMGLELPIGLISITTVLFLLAGINLLTKQVATISGVAFTAVFFLAFTICERLYGSKEQKRRGGAEENQQERFRLEVREHLSPESLSVRPGNVLVAIHGPSDVRQVQTVLRETDTAKNDVVVLSVNPHAPRDAAAITSAEQVMDECETGVFSKVIRAAESEGKPAALLAVPGRDPYPLILQAADKLHSSRVVVTQSSRMSLDEHEE